MEKDQACHKIKAEISLGEKMQCWIIIIKLN